MRIRITFSKTGALRYIGHLDLHKIWERTARRAELALLYSQGFHPQPKIQLASALPLGFSSTCELVDLWVDGELDLEHIKGLLTEAAPPGLSINNIDTVAEKAPPLQTQVISAIYEVTLLEKFTPEMISGKIDACLQATTLPRERRGKPYDLRPLIESMDYVNIDSENGKIVMQLASRESATGRPEEVLDALNIPYEDTRVERTGFLFKQE